MMTATKTKPLPASKLTPPPTQLPPSLPKIVCYLEINSQKFKAIVIPFQQYENSHQ